MKVKSESEVAQSCLTLSNPMDCSPPGSSIQRVRSSPKKNALFHLLGVTRMPALYLLACTEGKVGKRVLHKLTSQWQVVLPALKGLNRHLEEQPIRGCASGEGPSRQRRGRAEPATGHLSEELSR